MRGTDFILRSLVADGIDHLFMVPGGLVDPFLPALGDLAGRLTPVVATQEGGAAFMADGYARASGRFGACLVIGGPGLTNTATAVSAALSDGVPVLLLSGEVATTVEGLGFFQDASAGTFDDVAVLRSLTKESYSVPDPRLLRHRYRGALKRMFDRERGPVHLSLPRNVQTGDVTAPVEPVGADLLASRPIDRGALDRHRAAFLGPRGDDPVTRVAILAGPELVDDQAGADLRTVAEALQIPIATTQSAKGILDEDHPLSLGVFGYAGTRHATDALLDPELELLVVLGTAYSQRDSLVWTGQLAPSRGTITVNRSPVHVGCHHDVVHFVEGEPGELLRWLLHEAPDVRAGLEATAAARAAWLTDRRAEDRYYDSETRTSDASPIHPARVVTACRAVAPRDTVAVVDSGAHRAFVVHHWEAYGIRSFLSAANLGPMGWAIGAGVGAKAARPERPVVVFTGDGCMGMHGLEIASSARHDLPVVYAVSNNAALGNVWLRAHTEGPVPGALTTLPDHDWAAFARSLGLQDETVRHPDELEGAFERAFGSGAAYLLDIKTDRASTTPVEPFAEAKAAWSYTE